ncbi:MAG: ATP-binding protein [Bacillota bacterium]|nr:ATP-binding protein [Bacillota bacterium]
MIERTILSQIAYSVENRPITLITGPRQVGKSTLANLFTEKGFSYVSLASSREARSAQADPGMFLSIHKWPLIIDEVQKAKPLFEEIEAIVDEQRLKDGRGYGMYILTGSQLYRLMEGISESMAGRVGIIHMPTLSRNETIGVKDVKFSFDPVKIAEKADKTPMDPAKLFELIHRGFYPELWANKALKAQSFYSDYVETYIERDVSDIAQVEDKYLFRSFMELMASLSGQQLNYETISKSLGIDARTVKKWLSILLSSDLVYLLEPYSENSITKRIVKRPKLYFSDTGLACYLAKVSSGQMLEASFLKGAFLETYVIGELRKTYLNNGLKPPFYYYRDSNGNEVDLLVIEDGKMHLIECKSGMNYDHKAIKSFSKLAESKLAKGSQLLICNTDSVYPLGEGAYAVPLSGI